MVGLQLPSATPSGPVFLLAEEANHPRNKRSGGPLSKLPRSGETSEVSLF